MPKEYNVFISWSGVRSKSVAEALREWLPMVIQTAKPFMSETDIDKGSRGLDEIASALEGTRVGIICLTPENLDERWILYEAGALSKTIDKSRLCTYLLAGLGPEDIRQPLGMFQHTRANQHDTKKLIHTINSSIGDEPVLENYLNTIFEKMWPDLNKRIEAMPSDEHLVNAKRPPEDMLAEILELSRAAANSRKQIEWMDQYAPLLRQLFPFIEQALKSSQLASQIQPMPSPSAERQG